jgi:hypothetical protein
MSANIYSELVRTALICGRECVKQLLMSASNERTKGVSDSDTIKK